MSVAENINTAPVGTATPATQAFSRVAAYVCDDATRQTVLQVASESGWRHPVVEIGGIRAAIEGLADGLSPDLLMIDVTDSDNPLAEINALADVCDPGTRVIAFGTANDVKLYRGLVAAGIVDYLLKPIGPADILRAVAEAADVHEEAQSRKGGRLVVVTGTRGGVGASMLASSLAWCVAEELGNKTALLDLDLRFGTSALTYNVEPGTGMSDMLADPDRIDTLFLERASVSVGDHLSIFATEAPLSAAPHFRPDSIKVVSEELQRAFDWIIADIPRDMLADQPDLISVADTVLIVTDLSLAAMRDALRLKTVIAEFGPTAHIRLVGNQIHPASKSDLPKADFERTLEMSFSAFIPSDPKAVSAAEERGRPITAVRSKAAAVVSKLASDLFAPQEETKAKKPWGGSIFKGKKK